MQNKKNIVASGKEHALLILLLVGMFASCVVGKHSTTKQTEKKQESEMIVPFGVDERKNTNVASWCRLLAMFGCGVGAIWLRNKADFKGSRRIVGEKIRHFKQNVR